MKAEKKTLLERYGVPINHLDFEYVKTCSNVREMEKIVSILRSNEEGYFPDLTKCAEDKLRELSPNSPCLRHEEPIQTSRYLPVAELKPILEMTKDLKTKDHILANLVKNEDIKNEILEEQPIRKCGTIRKTNEEKNKVENTRISNEKPNNQQRVQSTDYRKWDQYDADAEVLKIELEQEREKEQLEIKNRLNLKKYQPSPKIQEISTDESNATQIAKKLTDIEKEKLSENYRIRGNDYFREKDYKMAIDEYSKAINLYPLGAALAYNNRAAANMKLEKFSEAIEDCNNCLNLDPENMKALLRLAEASNKHGHKREAQQIYQKILTLDSTNTVAAKSLEKLNKELGELPPLSATRMKIQECDSSNLKNQSVTKEAEMPKKIEIKYDLADLVKPNKITTKSKTPKTSETITNTEDSGNQENNIEKKPHNGYDLVDLVKPNKITKGNISKTSKPVNECEKSIESNKLESLPTLHLPLNVKKPMSKCLIEEI